MYLCTYGRTCTCIQRSKVLPRPTKALSHPLYKSKTRYIIFSTLRRERHFANDGGNEY